MAEKPDFGKDIIDKLLPKPKSESEKLIEGLEAAAKGIDAMLTPIGKILTPPQPAKPPTPEEAIQLILDYHKQDVLVSQVKKDLITRFNIKLNGQQISFVAKGLGFKVVYPNNYPTVKYGDRIQI